MVTAELGAQEARYALEGKGRLMREVSPCSACQMAVTVQGQQYENSASKQKRRTKVSLHVPHYFPPV